MAALIDGLTAQQHRDAARSSDRAASESFGRCDTDGFLSQWASGITARLHRVKAELCEAGGTGPQPALFDLDGNLVAAKQVQTRYGLAWGILESDSPSSPIVAWFRPSRATDPATRRANDERKGYRVGRVLAPLNAKVAASGTGLAGAASAHIVLYRTDGGFSRDVEIIDNAAR